MDWKKEIKFSDLVGRKSAPKTPAAKRPPAEKSVPFWKKEISLGRKPKIEPEPAAAAEPLVLEPVADEDWVREQLAAAAAAAAATEVPPPAAGIHPPVPASELPKPPNEKKSLLKKELSFRRKPKAPKQPKAEKQPKEPKQPRAKRAPKAKPQAGGHKALKRIVGPKIGAAQR